MPRRAKSQRFKHVKSHKVKVQQASIPQDNGSDSSQPPTEIDSSGASGTFNSSLPIETSASSADVTCDTSEGNVSCCSLPLLEHSYARNLMDCTVVEEAPVESPRKVPIEVLLEARGKLLAVLPNYCFPVVLDETQVSVVFISRQSQLSLQRSIQFNVNGDVTINVHCRTISSEAFITNIQPPIPLEDFDGVGYFVDRALAIVNSVRLYEVCAGVDHEDYSPAWDCSADLGYIDTNPYKECRYSETFRSHDCELLVTSNKWRCIKCAPLVKKLKRKTNSLVQAGERSNKTANIHLTKEEMLQKLKDQRKTINSKDEVIRRLRDKMRRLIEAEGKKIDAILAADFTSVLRDAKLTPTQSMFVQQQVKVSQLNNKCSMKWHPAIIRLALSIFETSRSAYEKLRDSGFIELPSSRTLFDYTHFASISLGLDHVAIESAAKRVDQLRHSRKYHVLMADEMYVSKKLVYKKATGELVGYTNLNSVDEDLKYLEDFFQSSGFTAPDKKDEVATKVLCYLVKGIANNVKEVVAIFATKSVSCKQMYVWTWQVISTLERCGIYVLAFVGDGCSVNRAFFKMHTPSHSPRRSGVIYATVNKAAPERQLFFLSDVPHLIKTLRNSFYTSRLGKKGKRCMTKNGQKIVWDYILKLFNDKKGKVVRKSHKLTAQHVHPDSYSCMKVNLAVQVLSNTVGTDLDMQKWPGTSETVNFILKVNNWFDCTNGAHTSMGKRKRNKRLLPYTELDDERFAEMNSFLEYLAEWQDEAHSAPLDVSGVASLSACVDDDVLNVLDEEDEIDDTPAGKRLPAAQTLLGIEMSTLALTGAIKFLLDKENGAGLDFVNARIFCQDPLEHYFSKQRAGGGGNTNPNIDTFLNKARTTHVVGQIGIKRKGNSGEVNIDEISLSNEPLRKKKCVRKGK